MSDDKHIETSKSPSAWERFIAWCIDNSIRNRLDLFGGLLAVGVVIVALFHLYDADRFTKNPLYIVFVSCIPIVQFFNSYLSSKVNELRERLTKDAKERHDKLVKELDQCHERISMLEPLYNSLEENFCVWSLYILKIMRFGNDSRASFYLYDDHGGINDQFRIVARESMDPQLKHKGRHEFPAGQGVIGTSWKENQSSFFCSDKVSESEYDEMMVSALKDRDAAHNLTMRARTILGHVILNSDKRKVGVVIVESVSSIKKKDREKVEKAFAAIVTDVSPYLSQLFSTYADILLNQESSKEIAK